jgi:predicted DNA binding protein
VVVELPPDADVRRLVEAVDGSFEGTELLAKRDRPRRPETIGAFRSELEDRLTDRQRTVLRTAYLADYFASPRGSTAEEVGETLDISGATVLYHLRNGQRELLDALFDEGNDRPGD